MYKREEDYLDETIRFLKTMVLAGILAIPSICLAEYVYEKNNNQTESPAIVRVKDEVAESETKFFAPGEHIISMEIEKPIRRTPAQYENHKGYKVLSYDADSTTGIISFVNTEPVICEATGIDENGGYVYTDFGILEEKSEPKEEIDGYEVFGVNEHILLIPITDHRNYNYQYTNVDGYEIIDIVFYESGKTPVYSGSWALYTNNVPVKCQKVQGEYTEFGTPIQITKVKTL